MELTKEEKTALEEALAVVATRDPATLSSLTGIRVDKLRAYFGQDIGSVPPLLPPENSPFIYLEIGLIDPNPFYRLHRSELEEELKQSLVEQFAQLYRRGRFKEFVPLVRPKPDFPGRYEAAYGWLRLRGASLAEITRLPVIIQDLPDEEMFSFVINETRRQAEVSRVALARQVHYLHTKLHWSINSIAELYGLNRVMVSRLYHMNDLPLAFLEVATRKPDYTTIIQDIALAGLNSEQLTELLQLLQQEKLPTELSKKLAEIKKSQLAKRNLSEEFL